MPKVFSDRFLRKLDREAARDDRMARRTARHGRVPYMGVQHDLPDFPADVPENVQLADIIEAVVPAVENNLADKKDFEFNPDIPAIGGDIGGELPEYMTNVTRKANIMNMLDNPEAAQKLKQRDALQSLLSRLK